MPKESIRTFIALEIDEKIKEVISEIQNKIKQTNSLRGKWIPKDNLHLTLKFLGDIPLKLIEQINNKIKGCFKNECKISCNLARIGTFPNAKFPRVIWAGIEGDNSQIINLAQILERILFELGLEKEKRNFKTHITICRTKQILDYNKLKYILEEINKTFKPVEFIINKMTLFESNLTPKGPIYIPLSNCFLR